MTKTDEMFEAGQTEWCDIVELVVSSMIEEVEEKEMATNLGVGFYEWQQKRLNKAIEVGPS